MCEEVDETGLWQFRGWGVDSDVGVLLKSKDGSTTHSNREACRWITCEGMTGGVLLGSSYVRGERV